MALHRKPAALALAVALASLAPLSHAENVSAKLRINGFATAGASWVTDDFNSLYNADTFLPRSGTDENGNFTDANVLGIQLNYALDDQYDLVGQLVSKGIEGYETRADWAYIAYKASDRLRVRAGRFAAPFFLFSDNRNVGQAYAWATLPVELYGAVPLDSIAANIEFEMIGAQDPKLPGGTLMMTGFDRSNLGRALAAHGALVAADPYPDEHFFERSDNYQLARKGVVAHTISGWAVTPDYHQPTDTIDRLDIPFMTRAIQSLIEPVRWLASGEFRPEWNEGGRPPAD